MGSSWRSKAIYPAASAQSILSLAATEPVSPLVLEARKSHPLYQLPESLWLLGLWAWGQAGPASSAWASQHQSTLLIPEPSMGALPWVTSLTLSHI